MSVGGPCERVEKFVVGVVDHRILRVAWVFGLGFGQEVGVLLELLGLLLVVLLFLAENLYSGFRVASYFLSIHGPYRFINVKNMQQRAILCDDLIRILECLLIEVTCNLGFTQHHSILHW